jgi:hypothetical protein
LAEIREFYGKDKRNLERFKHEIINRLDNDTDAVVITHRDGQLTLSFSVSDGRYSRILVPGLLAEGLRIFWHEINSQ